MKPRVFSLAMLSGSIDDDVIIPFLDGLVEAGYQGVCPHPRNGLKVPYPSRLYWQKLSRVIDLAMQRGLQIWHYDEFPYPSGQLAGTLTEDHPEMAAKSLALEHIAAVPNADGFINIGRGALLALLRYRETDKSTFDTVQDVTLDTGVHLDSWYFYEGNNLGYTATTRLHREDHERAFPKRLLRYYAPQLPLADNEKLIAIKIIPGHLQAQGTSRPDLTRPEVTEITTKHIYDKFGKIDAQHHLQNTPIFQDEVAFYTYFPWNNLIENTLRERWQEHFAANLLAIFDTKVAGWEWIRYQYRRLCADLLEENWYVKIKDSCRANHLLMTGHLPGEESIGAHAQIMGDAFKNLRHFDIPGYDIISSTLPDDIDRSHATGIKLVQSAAWIERKNQKEKSTMAEVFGANGFHQDLQRNRTVLAWLGIHDIKQICDHATFSDSRSMAKYDAPPIHNRFNPMHRGAPDLWHWFHWFCDLMDRYQFYPQTLVLFPFDSLTRFVWGQNQWLDETTLLESFFHYLCAYSLDCVFLPSHLLDEITVHENGFDFRGHRFTQFIVPPFASMHESTFAALTQWRDLPGFSWILPGTQTGVEIFGADNPQSTFTPVSAACVKNCTEKELVTAGANWFNDILKSPLQDIQSPKSVIKSLRINPQTGEKLRVIINPHDDTIELTSPFFGRPLPQPPEGNFLKIETEDTVSKVLLAPRATAIFKDDSVVDLPKTAARTIIPQQCRWRMTGDNFWSIKTGTVQLESHDAIPFAMGAISALISLPGQNNDGVKPHFSIEDFAKPLALTARFPLQLDAPLTHLTLILDSDSMPPGAMWFWDDTELTGIARDIFETQNNVYDIPSHLLTAGAHHLRMKGQVTNAAQGILERPILQGNFTITSENPLRLHPASREWQSAESTFPLWHENGFPEAFGPAEYRCEFTIPDTENAQFLLRLPPCIGVMEIAINGIFAGRSNWEPRDLPLPKVLLHTGKNEVQITLHGSWNNIFSRLNQQENGMREMPVIWQNPIPI